MNISKVDKSLRIEIKQLIKIGIQNGHLSRTTVIHLLLGKNRPDDYSLVCKFMQENGVNFIDEDVEWDLDLDLDLDLKVDNNLTVASQPFDSTKINIAQKPLSVEGLVKRLKFSEIDLNTGFQRKSGLWDQKTKSQLIESLMLRIPLPVFYFDGTNDEKWLVIDGLQRLSTFYDFFISKTLVLEGMEYFTDFSGCTYNDIPRIYIRRMEETQLFLYIIQPGTPFNVKYNIFKRINTPGLKLEPQEIRHALYQGKSTILLKKLAESEAFEDTTGGSISNERMLGCEFALRFLAFKSLGIEVYGNYGKLDLFLNEAMDHINKMDDNSIRKYEKCFYNGLKNSNLIFGNYTFRRISSVKGGRKNPINVALFESWMLALCDLDENNMNKLISNREKLMGNFIKKLEDKTFNYDISSGKSIAVERRIDTISKLVEGVIKK